ncbi:hypothetical protein EMIT0P12_10737 [Pseudomonas sp. IT-P12]
MANIIVDVHREQAPTEDRQWTQSLCLHPSMLGASLLAMAVFQSGTTVPQMNQDVADVRFSR